MIYHVVGQKLRDYQQKALNIALNSPGVALALPTGTGKTLVGCAWACELLNSGQARRILVLEPSRFLVVQVEEYYRNRTNIPTSMIYGMDTPQNRSAKWKSPAPLIVATPQVSLSDVSLSDFDAVIIDECHHTTGDYAYKKLLDNYQFRRRLGLSATIADRLRTGIQDSIGPIFSWSWTDPDIEPFVPEWYGEIYDTELNEEEGKLLKMLEAKRNALRGSPLAAMPSLAIRMLSRDGALALAETLRGPTTMALLLRDDVTPMLARCRLLHKLEQLKSVLTEHDFEKAIVFVDRVCVANEIAKHFGSLNPVCLLGRLHGGSEAQKLALENAKRDEVKLVISTSVGEEGIDLPEADLIISWSNTSSPVRFIQRKGRGMRVSSIGKKKVKVDVFIGTPDTPDYDALYFGIDAASKAGLEILLGTERKELLKATTVGHIKDYLESRAMTPAALAKSTGLPGDIVRKHTAHLVSEGHAIYIYDFDVNEMLDRNIRRITEWIGEMSEQEVDFGIKQWLDSPYRYERLASLLNFHLRDSDRLYIDAGIIPALAQGEYSRLFNCDNDVSVEVTYGFSSRSRAEHTVQGNWQSLAEKLKVAPVNVTTYLTFAYKGAAESLTVTYHGKLSEESLQLIVKNACWLAGQARDAAKRMRDTFV
jgi:superfamily II DNA or RNA helicase